MHVNKGQELLKPGVVDVLSFSSKEERLSCSLDSAGCCMQVMYDWMSTWWAPNQSHAVSRRNGPARIESRCLKAGDAEGGGWNVTFFTIILQIKSTHAFHSRHNLRSYEENYGASSQNLKLAICATYFNIVRFHIQSLCREHLSSRWPHQVLGPNQKIGRV